MNILDFFDGDITSTIQRALDSGQPELFIPAGTYTVSRPLKIRSNTALTLGDGAHLIAGDGTLANRGDFLLTNANIETGDENITVTGGMWDGNFSANPKSEMYDENGYSGALMNFVNVRGLTLRGLRLHNSSGYFTRFARLDGFLIEDISFSHDTNIANNDGVHLGGCCENGVIRRIRCLTKGTTRDDLIALNADDCITRTENRGLPRGPIRNILVEDVRAELCHCLVRLLSVTAEISDITIRDIGGGCRSNAVNMDAARYCRAPLIPLDDPTFVGGAGNIRNVTIEGMTASQAGGSPLICAETNATGFVMRNFTRVPGRDVSCADATQTILLRNISPSRIQLKGLSDGSPDIEMTTAHGDVFTLPAGGFDYFSIDTV